MMTAHPAEQSLAAGARRGHAFGIEIDADFEVPGLPAGAPTEPLPRTRVRLAPAADIDAAWADATPQRLQGDAERAIDRDERLGYRLYAKDFGLATIAPDGGRVVCTPPGESIWHWQRFLVARVLPWAAVVAGREAFHASAVRLGDRAVAFVAPTGGGKTSLALQLVLRGAGFVSDDVLTLQSDPGGAVCAHPGAGIASVRAAERAAVEAAGARRIGAVIGTSGKTYVALNRENEPLPLSALYYLQPLRPGSARIERGGVDARALIGSAFISGLSTPDRLAGLLTLCSAVAARVPLFRAHVDPAESSETLSAALHAHAAELTGAPA